MLLYKRFFLIVLIIAGVSYLISLLFIVNLVYKFVGYVLIYAILYLLLIAVPYTFRDRLGLFDKYIVWIEKQKFHEKG